MDTIIKFFKQKDKQKHILITLVIGLFITAVSKDPLLGIVISMLVGVGKEVYDEYREGGTGFDNADIVADLIGAVVGSGLGFMVIILL